MKFQNHLSKMIFIPSLILFQVVSIFCEKEILNSGEIKEVYGVVSGSAHLPCNITSATEGDSAR